MRRLRPFAAAADPFPARRRSTALARVSPLAATVILPKPGMTGGEKMAVAIGIGAALLLGISFWSNYASASQGTTPTPSPPVPAPTPAPAPVAPATPRQQAAIAMQTALAARGYCQADSGVYTAYQSAAGLTADGYPGTNTMTTLASDLSVTPAAGPWPLGPNGAALKSYRWSTALGWTAGNVPAMFVGGSQAQWNPTNASGCGAT